MAGCLSCNFVMPERHLYLIVNISPSFLAVMYRKVLKSSMWFTWNVIEFLYLKKKDLTQMLYSAHFGFSTLIVNNSLVLWPMSV